MSHRPVTVISAGPEPAFAWLRDVIAHRDLLRVLVWRDIAIRYKQSVIGIAWAVLQPLTAMLVFTFVFGSLVQIPSDGLPYPLFSYCGLLPWLFFQRAVTQGSLSLVAFGGILAKVYFPRVIAPIAAIATALFDFLVAFSVLIPLMLFYGVTPGWPVLLLPAFVLLACAVALALALWLSALNVEFRDIQHVLPFVVQLWMFLTPVVYPASVVPEWLQPLFSANPLVAVIEGFRWTLAGGPPPSAVALTVSVGTTLILGLGGSLYFNRAVRTMVDRV